MPTRTLFVGDIPEPFFRGTGPEFPPHDLYSVDDEQVKEILLKLEIHSLFTPPASTVPQASYATDDRHPTHRFLFCRISGYPNDRDNGYLMYGWRRSAHSFADTERFMGQIITAGSHVETVRRIDGKGLS